VDQAFLLQFADRGRITAQAIPREDVGRAIVGIRQRLFQEAFGGFPIPRLRKVEVHGLPLAVDGPEQVQPASRNPNEGFIHVPGGRFLLHVPPQPPVDFRSVALNPTPNGGMVQRQAALRHQFLQIPQAQGKPAVPPHAGNDDDRFN